MKNIDEVLHNNPTVSAEKLENIVDNNEVSYSDAHIMVTRQALDNLSEPWNVPIANWLQKLMIVLKSSKTQEDCFEAVKQVQHFLKDKRHGANFSHSLDTFLSSHLNNNFVLIKHATYSQDSEALISQVNKMFEPRPIKLDELKKRSLLLNVDKNTVDEIDNKLQAITKAYHNHIGNKDKFSAFYKISCETFIEKLDAMYETGKDFDASLTRLNLELQLLQAAKIYGDQIEKTWAQEGRAGLTSAYNRYINIIRENPEKFDASRVKSQLAYASIGIFGKLHHDMHSSLESERFRLKAEKERERFNTLHGLDLMHDIESKYKRCSHRNQEQIKLFEKNCTSYADAKTDAERLDILRQAKNEAKANHKTHGTLVFCGFFTLTRSRLARLYEKAEQELLEQNPTLPKMG